MTDDKAVYNAISNENSIEETINESDGSDHINANHTKLNTNLYPATNYDKFQQIEYSQSGNALDNEPEESETNNTNSFIANIAFRDVFDLKVIDI